MVESTIKIRVRYGETDQMGYMYHGNYAQYYEIGRVELLRELGVSYKKLENQGILMPVVSMNIRYLRPAKYDDLVTVKTSIKELRNKRIKFDYDLKNEDNKLLNAAEVILAFVDKNTEKSLEMPKVISDVLKGKF